jgi:hypothetical protein
MVQGWVCLQKVKRLLFQIGGQGQPHCVHWVCGGGRVCKTVH